jgi:outer membrane protein assembly factor BamB
LLALLAAASAAQDPGWTRFRGPNGTGIAEVDGLPRALDGTTRRWRTPLPRGHSSPVLHGERVFVTAVEGDVLSSVALERASGRVLWKRDVVRTRAAELDHRNSPASPSPAVDDDTLVVFFEDVGLLAYDHAGEERWRLALGPFDNGYGMGASPILVDGRVLLACDQTRDSFLLCVAAKSGAVLWRAERPSASSGHCTPIVWTPKDGAPQVVLPGSFLLDAYDARSGQRLWWVAGLPGEMKSVPVLLDERIFLHGYAMPMNDLGNQIELPFFEQALVELDGDQDGRVSPAELPRAELRELFVYFDLVADGSLDETEWDMLRISLASVNSAQAIRPGGEGDRSATNVLWRQHRGIPQLPSPLVYQGVYYMLADQGGLLTLLDPDTGEQLSKERLEGLDAYYASPVAGDGKVYCLSETGLLTVLAAGRAYEPLHRANFDQPCYATPALEDGRIWLRTAERLYCFGQR